jgi:hypothetical protein
MEPAVVADPESLENRIQELDRRCSHLKQWLWLAWILGILCIIRIVSYSFQSDPFLQARYGDFEHVSAESIQRKSKAGDSYLLTIGEDGSLNVLPAKKN